MIAVFRNKPVASLDIILFLPVAFGFHDGKLVTKANVPCFANN